MLPARRLHFRRLSRGGTAGTTFVDNLQITSFLCFKFRLGYVILVFVSFAPRAREVFDLTDNGIAIDDKLNENLSGDISLESIWPSTETSASASRRRTRSGAFPPHSDGGPGRDLHRSLGGERRGGRHARLRRPPAREYRPRRARKGRSGAVNTRTSVSTGHGICRSASRSRAFRLRRGRGRQVYRPRATLRRRRARGRKVYRLGDVIAEAERRSANWKVPKPADSPLVEEPQSRNRNPLISRRHRSSRTSTIRPSSFRTSPRSRNPSRNSPPGGV